MAIVLGDHIHTAKVVKSGHDIMEMVAGQSVKVETSPEGAELLNAECPAGKAWSVRVIVEITEIDA